MQASQNIASDREKTFDEWVQPGQQIQSRAYEYHSAQDQLSPEPISQSTPQGQNGSRPERFPTPDIQQVSWPVSQTSGNEQPSRSQVRQAELQSGSSREDFDEVNSKRHSLQSMSEGKESFGNGQYGNSSVSPGNVSSHSARPSSQPNLQDFTDFLPRQSFTSTSS